VSGLATLAGVLVRVLRQVLPGLLGAAAVSAGLGELAGHVFGHGLAPWVALLVAGVFALWFGVEVNRAPRAPRPPGE
jgi:hypothetical protein